MHASVDLFLAALVFGAGFHIAGAIVGFVGDLLSRAGNRTRRP